MGATNKSITGLFANVCGRNTCGRFVRKQIVAGQGTRSAASQGDPSLAHALSRHFSSRLRVAGAGGRARAVASEMAGWTAHAGVLGHADVLGDAGKFAAGVLSSPA